MDPSYLEDEPNRVADVYRNYRPIAVPFEVEKYLDFIDISEDGYTILGSSNLSGRYWRGSVWYFKNTSLAPNKDLCDTGIECQTTVCDGKFIGSNKTIIVGEDSGAVTIFELNQDDDQPSTFERRNSKYDHNSSVLTISVSDDKNTVITAGMDLCIKVWDAQELVPTHTFNCAHSHHVTSVAFASDEVHVFASCSLDGSALLWDTRQPKPATVLIDEPREGLNALAWQSGETNTLAVGSNFGIISNVDPRVGKILNQCSLFQRPIYRLLSVNPRCLAACADSHEVKVIDPLSENLAVRYEDTRHTDYVRGLAYDKVSKNLVSCGWDKQVFSHTLEA